jgi:hypothetical protein
MTRDNSAGVLARITAQTIIVVDDDVAAVRGQSPTV